MTDALICRNRASDVIGTNLPHWRAFALKMIVIPQKPAPIYKKILKVFLDPAKSLHLPKDQFTALLIG